MAIVSWAAVLLVSTLSVVGCMGQYPGMSPFGSGGGYDLGYGGVGGGASQPYYSPQPYQPYYQSQPYVYSGNGGVYVYQPDQVVTPGPEGTTAAPPGPWLDRRHQRQEDRIRHTWNSGRLSPEEYRRLEREQAQRRGTDARLRADGNLSPQDRARLNPMQSRSGRPINQLTNQGAQPGPHGQLRPHGQLQPNAPPGTTAPTRATMQPGPMAPARPAAQPRATSSRPPGNGAAAP